ncbi:MAG: hypothetical protein K8F30_05095, partial [Taibaiella sp.]|nr:hypothetical protein [Taibaiella sp.]
MHRKNIIRRAIGLVLLPASALLIGGNAFATSGIGNKLDQYCEVAANVKPYNGDCALCHGAGFGSNDAVEPNYSWSKSGMWTNFCPTVPEPPVTEPPVTEPPVT